VGRFDLVVNTDTNSIESYTWKLVPIDDSHCPRDSALDEVIGRYNAATEEKYSRYITRFADTYTHPARDRESELGRLFSYVLRDSLGLDIMMLGSGSMRIPKMGPIVDLKELAQMFPFEEEIFRITVTGRQLKAMLTHVFRPEAAMSDHAEYYQYSRGIKLVYSLREQRITELTFEGNPIEDERIFRVGIQGYHYKNSQDILGISEEELNANAPSKVLATSVMDVMEEKLSRIDLMTCPGDVRWIMQE